MHPNAELIQRFYSAFARRDAKAMGECYDDDVVFGDPVFPELHGEQARKMWRMLCARGKDLRIELSAVQADDHRGSAHWVAHYTFSATGHKVTNRIDARFEFRGGRVVRHRDDFHFYRWARQALGAKGLLLGWLPPVHAAVRRQAAQRLAAFEG